MTRESWLTRAALRLVPADWRDGVARDLSDEPPAGPGRDAARVAAIGGRLRLARALDALAALPFVPESGIMRDIGRDMRLAVRGMVRHPSASLAVVATLAIGIGANTAIFSVFNWILFRPVPGVARPDELATVRFLIPGSDGRFFVSYRDYADLRDGIRGFAGLAASSPMTLAVAVGPGLDPELVESELVTSNYFDVLGVPIAMGRGFARADEQPGANTPPAVISAAMWQRTFSSDPAVLGRTLVINGHAFTIAGVAPAGFGGRSLVTATRVWVPLGAHMAVAPGQGADLMTNRRATLFIDAVGRLRPGASLAQVQQQAQAVAAAVEDFGGRKPTPKRGNPQPTMFPGLSPDVYTIARLTTVWRLLAGAVGLVLLLACANAANLLLARAFGRRREIAVCQAIGASRLRIVRQQLVEGLVLSLAAGAAGLFVARAMTSIVDGMRIVSYLPAVADVGIDWRVELFTLGVAVATGVVFSLAPAFVTSRVDLQESLKDGLTSSRRGKGRLRGALVAIQVAVSVLLLVSAGLFVRTLVNVRSLDLGLNLDGLVSFSVDPTKLGRGTEASHEYFRGLLERLRAVPGIQAAAFSLRTPYSNIGMGDGFRREDEAAGTSHNVDTNRISSDYFRTLGTPILAGRDFTDQEFRAGSGETYADAVIVNERLAREVFPRGGAVGSFLILDYPKGKRVQIVGVVGDIRDRPVTNDPAPYMYIPGSSTWGSVSVRTTMGFAATASAIRGAARAIEPGLPPVDLEPMSAGVDRVISEERLFARLSSLFAIVASLLAAVGIYGMMAGAVAERRREFGIRLALGAEARSVLTLVLSSALPVALIGLAAGLGGSIAMRTTIASRLYGVEAWDPATLAAVTGLLLLVALTASLVPAIRASRVDPVQSLRVE